MLPFDPASFSYNPSPWAAADQVEAFRKLNALVLHSNPKPAVVDFINGTYPYGVDNYGSQPDPTYITAGWNITPTQRETYNKVIKPYCRNCHMSQTATEGGYDFLKADDADALRALIVADVCKTYRMPHAQQPMKNFWSSGARAHLLEFFGRHDLDGEACKP